MVDQLSPDSRATCPLREQGTFRMDLKWLTEIFRLSGWQIFALTLAAAIVYFGPTIGISPLDELPTWSKQIALVALIVYGSLAMTAVFQAATKPLISALRSAFNWLTRMGQRVRAVLLLNGLSQGETEILRYLVTANEQAILVYLTDANVDALFKKGLLTYGTYWGSGEYSAYRVPDEVWNVLQARKERFHLQNLPPAPPWSQHPGSGKKKSR